MLDLDALDTTGIKNNNKKWQRDIKPQKRKVLQPIITIIGLVLSATRSPPLKEEGFKNFTSKPLEEMIRRNNNKYKLSDMPRF